ncbi:structural maintenance of chromosomes protein 6-like isoform X2 [Ostrea edulis]|uniref:structural maintenance of chromosomes protein 6-like isoform X2 n=1 Tax=Ostrea edulis TaxID=37623 RepID=UPI0024AE953D|nr:structural maintenance of chromosomes protein 6-like isoform X2 [Ostrea edulis]XP_056019652.1 structural maintenance of chromosomes protein 6-like isoform X2 [Ostrea edulis]
MSKRKGEELAGPSRKKHTGQAGTSTSQAGTSSRVSDEEEEFDLTQRADFEVNTKEADIGIVEKISLKNFMCHSRLDVSLGPHVNFIVGRNGSGKSAIITALVVGLGGKASVTNRGNAIKGFIKSGKQTAEVEIHLRNRGPDAFKFKKYGDKIIVDRKFTHDGSSSYKLKSKEGKIISTKREELTAILDQFNIQVDNPVSILNQDTSRNFLNSKSPHDRYKFFLKATQLEQMLLDYTRANEQREITKDIIEKKQQTLPTLEKEVLEWEQKFKSLTALDELKSKMEKRKQELAWAFVISREREVQQMQKNLHQEESRIPKFKQKVEEAKAKVESCIQKHNELKELLKSTNDEVKQLRPQFDSAKETLKEAKADLRVRQNDFRKKEAELRKMAKERDDINSRIQELQKSAQHDYEAERRLREEKIGSLEEQAETLKAQQSTTEHDLENFRAAVTKLKGEERQVQVDVNGMKSYEDKRRKQLNDLLGAKNDRLARFGAFMPTLLQHIEERFRRGEFHQKPRGPLGACFKLRDSKWAMAMERCLASLLLSFCCHDHHDEKILESIFDRVCNDRQRPSIIVSGFKNAVYDVSRFRAQSDLFPAVFDMVECNDPVVINTLIDQRGIENILLIEDKVEARTVMDPDVQAQPRNCQEAFTVEGDQIYSKPSLRYYSNNNTHAKFLTSNTEQDIHRLQGELTQLQQEIQKKEQVKVNLRDNLRQNQNEEKKCETQLMKIGQRLNKLNNEIYELKSIEDPAPIDVTTLEEEVNNLESQIQDMSVVRDQLHTQYQNSLSQFQAEEQKFKEVESKMREKAEVGEPLKDEFGLAQVEIEQAKSHRKHYEEKLSEQEAKIRGEQKKVEEESKELESDIKKAQQICAEKINTRRTIQNLESEVTQINKQIRAEEKSRGNSEEITRTYYEKRDMYRKIMTEVKQCRNFIQHMEKVMKHRQQQYFEFRKIIAMRAKYFFIVLLNNRNYTGKMSFNHSKETLEMNVQPTTMAGEGARDMRSLSGGERSFSTVCFILALWDAMESPFRCLDEFDVFMDMVNRRISMDMMMAVARNQKHKQFIFLTPQNMSKLGIEIESRKIFWMPDPDRGQGVLPFEPIHNEQEEEDGD